MTTLLICTSHALGLAIGFYAGCRYSRARAEFRGVINPAKVLELSRTDAENAAGMVS